MLAGPEPIYQSTGQTIGPNRRGPARLLVGPKFREFEGIFEIFQPLDQRFMRRSISGRPAASSGFSAATIRSGSTPIRSLAPMPGVGTGRRPRRVHPDDHH
ncbi:MAG: hypothetical protein WCC64_02115 [Aliidongia sp.]